MLLLIMQISERCLSKTIERRTTTRSPTQTKTPETTKHNEENQQIQDFISGHLYEITKKLMDLKSSNSTTRLTNDQVKPNFFFLIFQWIIFPWIQREDIHKHISNDSPSAFKLKPHMASVHSHKWGHEFCCICQFHAFYTDMFSLIILIKV